MGRHLGISLQAPGGLSGAVALLGTAYATTLRFLSGSDRESIGAFLRALAARLFGVRVLLTLGLGLALAASTVSSILVTADGAAPLRLTVRPVDRTGGLRAEAADEKSDPVRVVVLTSPLGRTFQVAVDRYLAETVDVYPILGVRLRPGRELRRAPAVLLRPSAVGMSKLEDGGTLVVETRRAGEGAWREVARHVGRSGERRSYVLGRAVSLPPTLTQDWLLELATTALSESDRLKTYIEWKRPRLLPTSASLEPGMTLRARVVAPDGESVLEECEAEVRSDELQDEKLSPTPIR